jgi:hypothetical protein
VLIVCPTKAVVSKYRVMVGFSTAGADRVVAGKILVAGQNGVSESANVKTDYSNIAPRLAELVQR